MTTKFKLNPIDEHFWSINFGLPLKVMRWCKCFCKKNSGTFQIQNVINKNVKCRAYISMHANVKSHCKCRTLRVHSNLWFAWQWQLLFILQYDCFSSLSLVFPMKCGFQHFNYHRMTTHVCICSSYNLITYLRYIAFTYRIAIDFVGPCSNRVHSRLIACLSATAASHSFSHSLTYVCVRCSQSVTVNWLKLTRMSTIYVCTVIVIGHLQ